jgi:hypothetical protein
MRTGRELDRIVDNTCRSVAVRHVRVMIRGQTL